MEYPKEIQNLIDKVNEITDERDYWRDRCEKFIKEKENDKDGI